MGKVESEAEAIYDKLGRGAQSDVKTIAAALEAAEKAIRLNSISQKRWQNAGTASTAFIRAGSMPPPPFADHRRTGWRARSRGDGYLQVQDGHLVAG